MLHVVQVAVDAAMDVAAMLVRDRGREVVDDYHNLAILNEAGRISGEQADALRRLNGLRNAIVNKYNRFEEETVRENLESIQGARLAFAENVEHAL